MKYINGSNGRKFNLDTLAKIVSSGEESLEALLARTGVDEKKIVRAVAEIQKEKNVPATVTLIGRIIKQSEKSILFSCNGAENWFPKSACRIFERSKGNLDEITVYESMAIEKGISF